MAENNDDDNNSSNRTRNSGPAYLRRQESILKQTVRCSLDRREIGFILGAITPDPLEDSDVCFAVSVCADPDEEVLFYFDKNKTDVLYVPKHILKIIPAFRQLFDNDRWEEAKVNQMSMTQFAKEPVRLVLMMLNPSIRTPPRPKTIEQICQMIKFAHMYEIRNVLTVCYRWLSANVGLARYPADFNLQVRSCPSQSILAEVKNDIRFRLSQVPSFTRHISDQECKPAQSVLFTVLDLLTAIETIYHHGEDDLLAKIYDLMTCFPLRCYRTVVYKTKVNGSNETDIVSQEGVTYPYLGASCELEQVYMAITEKWDSLSGAIRGRILEDKLIHICESPTYYSHRYLL